MIEGYYLETRDRLFFAVKGFEHPADRVIAVLRYAPDPEKGDRMKGAVPYRRFYHFPEQEQFLQAFYPEYLAYLLHFQARLQSVPRSMIRRVYDPRVRLQELMRARAIETLEQDAADFAGILQSQADVPWSAIGITGSLLIGLHTGSSDLDIVAFGTENCLKIHRALRKLLGNQSRAAGPGDLPSPVVQEVRPLNAAGVRELYAQRIPDTRMDFLDFVRAENNKVNQGQFRSRTYFIRFVKDAHEACGTEGSFCYSPVGRVKISASIADDGEAIFTPCRYKLVHVRSLEGPSIPQLNEIVSFRGRFCEQARTGDQVIASGTLERVQSSRGDAWHRLLLGNSPEDSMVVPMHRSIDSRG
jgi:uncharacterized protein